MGPDKQAIVDVHADAERVTGMMRRLPFADLASVGVLGDLLQPQDIGRAFVDGDNYVWWVALGAHFRPKRIAEIGTRFGYSLKALVAGAARPPREYYLAVYDNESNPGDKNPLGVFARYFTEVLKIDALRLERVDTQTTRSLEVTHCDMAVVDADHSEAGCHHDCGLAFDALRPGGVLVVDDTRPGQVRDGCERFCRERGLEFAFLPSLTGIHLVRKPL